LPDALRQELPAHEPRGTGLAATVPTFQECSKEVTIEP
jgi:hypothetical protein